jgi:ABC-2 type transport system ATP-binding protein
MTATIEVLGLRERSGRAPELDGMSFAAGAVPLSEAAAHRVTPEQAYPDLTGDAVEFRGAAR